MYQVLNEKSAYSFIPYTKNDKVNMCHQEAVCPSAKNRWCDLFRQCSFLLTLVCFCNKKKCKQIVVFAWNYLLYWFCTNAEQYPSDKKGIVSLSAKCDYSGNLRFYWLPGLYSKKCLRGWRNPWGFALADPSLADKSASSGRGADFG